jgi:16S rRNA (cytosine967-C5)-methyltransferase
MTVATSLRRIGQIDDCIMRAMDTKKSPRPPSLQCLLRLGVAQILFMNVPDYAVVDSCVNTAQEMGLVKQKGLVNAVLRKISKEGESWLKLQDEVNANIPEWILKEWINDYGLRRAGEIGQASLVEAALDITIKEPAMIRYWEGTLGAKMLPTGTLRRESGGLVEELPGFSEGQWWVQDAAASIPALLFGDITGSTILDMCAAPGGKTAQLASMGGKVLAVDRSVSRLKRLEANIERLKLKGSVSVQAADASVFDTPEKIDHVLLDAPCSATGTVRRHPDILCLKKQSDKDRLIEIQARLIDRASSFISEGGLFVYCTCSLQKDEGEHQIEAFLERDNSFERAPVSADEFGGLDEMITEAGDVRIFPFHYATFGGMDGFFVSRLRKKSIAS